jgi:hypothetical protein
MTTESTDHIRRAVVAEDWQTALRLWGDYTAGILAEIRRGTCTTARMTEARDFLEWARRVVLCARAQTQHRLDAIHVAKQYGPAPSRATRFLIASL